MKPHRRMTRSQLYQEADQVSWNASGISNAKNEVVWILEHTLKRNGLMIHTDPNQLVSIDDQKKTWSLLERRASGEPIQYLLGTQEFCGLDFVVSRDVLIPRPDTELLVQVVSSRLNNRSSPLIVDVGTGSGCIAVTLAVTIPLATIIAIDQCTLAIKTAKENAIRHHIIPRIKILVGDLLSPLLSGKLEGKVAAIVSNLPYISHEEWRQLPREVRDFEPKRALDGGEDGLMLHRRLLREAGDLLMPNGVLVLEVGKGQASRLCQEIWPQDPFSVQEVRQDSLGIDRIVCLERKAS